TAEVSQANEKGAALSVRTRMSSTNNSARVTATLSDAVTLTVTVPETVAPPEGEEMLQVGGVVSGGAFCTLTVVDAKAPLLRSASNAVALSEWLPLPRAVVFQANEKGATMSVNPKKSSTTKSTRVTSTLSEAATLTVTVPETVAPPVGEEMLQVGGMVSCGA